jgi:hypothetical protein
MTEEGRPTGIKHEDAAQVGGTLDFEGRWAEVVHFSQRSHVGELNTAHLELERGDEHLVLWGYFSGDEFMEVGRERLER